MLGGFVLHMGLGSVRNLRKQSLCDTEKVKEMSEISAIGNTVVGGVKSTAPVAPTNPVEVAAPAADTTGVVVADRVEFSQEAQFLEKIQELPAVRQDRIDAIKDAIASNTYLTDEKLNLAISRMVDEAR